MQTYGPKILLHLAKKAQLGLSGVEHLLNTRYAHSKNLRRNRRFLGVCEILMSEVSSRVLKF
jgi:hypothetical protein